MQNVPRASYGICCRNYSAHVLPTGTHRLSCAYHIHLILRLIPSQMLDLYPDIDILTYFVSFLTPAIRDNRLSEVPHSQTPAHASLRNEYAPTPATGYNAVFYSSHIPLSTNTRASLVAHNLPQPGWSRPYARRSGTPHRRSNSKATLAGHSFRKSSARRTLWTSLRPRTRLRTSQHAPAAVGQTGEHLPTATTLTA